MKKLKKVTSGKSGKKVHRRKWSEEEVQNIRDGVKQFGVGKWREILDHYQFDCRTTVNIKASFYLDVFVSPCLQDKWRTMKRQEAA